MSSEDLFFQKVRDVAYDYAPEVPASVYAGMRSKYRKSRFFAWNASSLNVWYVAVLALLTGFGAYTMFPQNHNAQQAVASPLKGVSLEANIISNECASSNHSEISNDTSVQASRTKSKKAAPYCEGELEFSKTSQSTGTNNEMPTGAENNTMMSSTTAVDEFKQETQNVEQEPKIDKAEQDKPKKVWRTKVYKDK